MAHQGGLGRLGLLACLVACGAGCAFHSGPDCARLELRFRQNMDLILFSDFGEPAQMAVWLEHPETGHVRTLAVTRRSARGDWKGKSECPAALPRWFEVYRRETGRKGLPTPQAPAPDAVTRATPTTERFVWTADVEPGSRWVCWVEVNISADFNAAFPKLDEATQRMDTHFCGQPSLLYRAEVVAEPGARVLPALWGRTVRDTATGETSRDLKGITSAKNILAAIEVRVVRR